MSIDFSELSAFASHLSAVPAAAEVASMAAVEKVGAAIRDDAEADAPQLTGQLAGGFVLEVDGLSATVSNDTPYADEVEYGTSDTPAQPSLGPAFERHEGDLGNLAADAAARLLR